MQFVLLFLLYQILQGREMQLPETRGREWGIRKSKECEVCQDDWGKGWWTQGKMNELKY